MSVSFEEVFRSEFPGLHRFVRRRLGGQDADDLAAETFATALSRWANYDQSRPVRPWLYGIASNHMRHKWRAERRQLAAYARSGIDMVLDEFDDADRRADAAARERDLAAALAELRGSDREILLLSAWADLSDAEIAVALSMPLGTVKSRLHRTREKVRNRLRASGQSTERPTVAVEGDRR